MSPIELLLDLAKDGVELWIEGERLRYRAERGVLGPERRALLRRHRADLTALLGDPDRLRLEAASAIFGAEPADEGALPPRAVPGLVTCYACGFERNAEIPVCPMCHPAAGLPPDCMARAACSVLGPCSRRAGGGPCAVTIDAIAGEPLDRHEPTEERASA